MDASDLRVFEAVVRAGNITKASTLLNTVQSNVSAHIRALENELGVALLDRHARGVTPTVAGQKLLPYAQRFAQLLAEAKSAVNEAAMPHGTLIVGTLETTAAMRLPPVLTKYKGLFPGVDIVIRTGTTQELIEGVLQHQLEGAFVAGAVGHPDLIEEIMFPEELVLISSALLSPLEVLKPNSRPELLMLKSGCSYRALLESIVTARGAINFRILELGTIEAIIGLVSAGIGISLLPKVVVERPLQEGRISVETLPYEQSWVNTVFIRRRDGFFSNAAKHLVGYMKETEVSDNRGRSAVSLDQKSGAVRDLVSEPQFAS
jgi:LysR family transcriptional regulator, cell division regulator